MFLTLRQLISWQEFEFEDGVSIVWRDRWELFLRESSKWLWSVDTNHITASFDELSWKNDLESGFGSWGVVCNYRVDDDIGKDIHLLLRRVTMLQLCFRKHECIKVAVNWWNGFRKHECIKVAVNWWNKTNHSQLWWALRFLFHPR